MRICPFRFWTFSGSALFWLLASYPITAQIVPDATLPNNSRVTTVGNIITIEGGTQAGRNLFHSFQEFSVPTGSTAHFNNSVDIQNIISRVTGGSISTIDGLIQANRTTNGPNLFFINPNGITFGPNASLNIGGSFVASTANSLRFADGTEFSATNPQATPLLTISVPSGLQFGSNPGSIVNKSQASLYGAVNSNDPPAPAGLQVPEGKTLALVGGNVSLEGGNLTALGGRIELGSVGTGVVNLTEMPQGYYAWEYSGVQNFQDINLSNGAQVDASGARGGDIHVQGRNINLTDGAAIFSTTQTSTGGNLTVNAAESVKLSGDSTALSTQTSGAGSAGNLTITTRNLTVESGAFIQTPNSGEGQAGDLLVKATDTVTLSGTTTNGQPSGLSAEVNTDATGKGGNLTIETGRLTIRDGAAVDASTLGAAQAGNLQVTARDVELVGVGPRTPNGNFSTSGIFAQVGDGAIENKAGNAGTLTIETERLTALGGAQISTAARKGGNGGNLTINASDSIKLSGALPDATQMGGSSGIFVSAQKGSTGDVGNLKITTGLLTVENGAKISANNRGAGQGGTLTLDVRQLTIRDGGLVQSGSFAPGQGPGGSLTVKAADSVQVIGKGSIGSTPVVSALTAASETPGKAGDLNITTRSLKVQDGAEVSVSGTDRGSGSSGKLTIAANDLRLDRGSLTATTNAGEGAKISLQNLDLLLMQNNSLISAQAFNNANGGNITIDAAKGVVVAVPNQNNYIIAKAVGGEGGKIDITTGGIFGIAQRKSTPGNTNIIDASSDFGLAGTVTINTPDVDPVRGLVVLPTGIVDVSRQIASGCAAFDGKEVSQFIVTGRGGLPPSPDELLSSDVVWSDTRIPKTTAQHSQNVTTTHQHDSHTGAIVPATGWVFNGKGEVTLISSASGATGLGSTPATCPKR